MRAPLLASASIAVFLVGCVPAPENTETAQKQSAVPEFEEHTEAAWKEGAIPGVAFEYPESWGEMTLNQEQEWDTAVLHHTFNTLNDELRYPNTGSKSVRFSTRSYDMGEHRYEEVCESVSNLCDTTVQSDMYEQKSDLEKSATMTIAGYPAKYSDRYDPSGGGVMHSWTFFTDTDRVSIDTWFDISSLYDDEYNKRVSEGLSPSISELVREDIGENYEDPTAKLIALYPEQTKDLQEFLDDVTHMIDSMQPTKH